MSDTESHYVSIDTGGTFTDGYVSYPGGATTVKVPTTNHDLTVCFRNCIDEAAARLDYSTEEFLVNTEVIRFSTTIGTNTVIERTGPKVGLIVTDGHQSDLFRTEHERREGGEAITDDDLVVGVDERTTTEGTVEESVEAREVREAAKTLMNRGAKLLVISFVNSFYNEENEERARTIIETEYPPHFLGPNRVLTANEVTSRPGFRARTSTALINAYIHRPMARSLYKAEDDVREHGYARPLLIGQSTGGVAGVSKTVALHTYNSGPVAGLLGADAYRELYDLDSVVSADMGGTSIDLGTIVDGAVERDLLPEIAGLPVHVPMIDVRTAGAGGGSIASVDDGDLTVGPESAGAEPGPACYDLGGIDPTVTDADVLLGYIDPDYFLGGDQQLNAERAEGAIEREVADPLDVATAEAAMRIRRQVDSNVAGSIESQLDARGEDPSDVTLIAYGGAGPTHCCSFARKAGIERIITGPSAAEFSAFGGATLDVEHRYTRAYGASISVDTPDLGRAKYENLTEDLEDEAVQDMAGEGFDAEEIDFEYRVLATADGEVREVTVPPGLADGTAAAVVDAFDVDPEDEIELESLVLVATGPVPTERLEPRDLADEDPSAARKGQREAYWPEVGWETTDVYQREDLQPGNVVDGRALIEAKDTTYVITEPWTFEVDEYGNGLLER